MRVQKDGQRYVEKVAACDGLDVGDQVQGRVRFPAGTSTVETHLNMARFEVVGKDPLIV